MKFIEGFLILKFKRGSKKGQEYIKNTKRYIWIVPDYLLNDIELGDEVLVNSTRYDNKNKKYKPAKEKVLVVNIFEKDEEPIKRKMVLKILKKNKTKKNIIKVVSIFSASAIGLCALGGVVLYNIVKSNINYTEQQAKEIALSQVPGQVVYVTKDIDLDHLGLEYDIKIKDKNNIIREVTVDSKYGAISDFENYYYND